MASFQMLVWAMDLGREGEVGVNVGWQYRY